MKSSNSKIPFSPKKLTLNVALTAALLSCYGSRKVFAGSCTGSNDTYSCSNAADVNTDVAQNINCTTGPLTVSTTAGFGIEVNNDSALVLSTASNDCDMILTDNNNSNIVGHSGILTFNSSPTPKTTNITTTGDISGSLNMGLWHENSAGAGDVIINTNDGVISGESTGLYARDLSSVGSSISITTNGQISGEQNYGIRTYNGTQSSDVTVNAGINSHITGYNNGLGIRNYSQIAGVSTLVVNGQATGIVSAGIRNVNDNSSSAHITTGANEISGGRYGIYSYSKNNASGTLTISTGSGDVIGGYFGIKVRNNGTGSTNIMTTGTVTGISRYGINTYNSSSGSDIDITTGSSLVSGNYHGIYANNRSDTDASINITTNGDITGTLLNGILALNEQSDSLKNLTITTNTGTVQGRNYGIRATNYGSGTTTLNISGGVSATLGDAINATTKFNAQDLNIVTGNESITSSSYAIKANNYSSTNSSITIETTGIITANSNAGIRAFNTEVESKDITITTGAGEVSGGVFGIRTANDGYGETTIMTSGDINGTYGSGIYSKNSNSSSHINITTGDGTIFGGSYAISVNNSSINNGSVNISTTGDIITTGDSAIKVRNSNQDSNEILITTGIGAISGNINGIEAVNYGSGMTKVDTTGPITATTKSGIHIKNHGSDVVIDTLSSVLGMDHGIYAYTTESANITITTSGSVTGTNGYGIKATSHYSGTSNNTLNINVNENSVINGGILNDNGRGDSSIIVDSNATVSGNIKLGSGSDLLEINGNGFAGIISFDGGDDTSSSDGYIDTLHFKNSVGTINASTIQNWEQIIIGSGSTISINGNNTFQVGSFELENNSTVSLNNGLTSDQLSFTGDFIGGGTINLDTVIGNNDVLTTDRIIFQQNSTGHTILNVTNIGGNGGVVNQTDILLVESLAESTATFSLSSPIVINDINFELMKIGNNWYLNSRPNTYFVGGTVFGLLDNNYMTLQNNETDAEIITSNGPFVFSTPLESTQNYSVTIELEPENPIQPCLVSNSSGPIDGADIDTVLINCDVGDDLVSKNGFEEVAKIKF